MFRGFQFIHFKSMKDAKNFVGKNFYFGGKQLDCKISIDHDDFTTNSLKNIREPKKVVAENLPVNISKNDVKKLFSRFGMVEEAILTPAQEDQFQNAFITFHTYKSAVECIQEKQILLDDDKITDVKFAKPKFSSYMLKKIDPIQSSYIFMIMKERINFDPVDFAYQQDNVMKSEDSKLLLEQFYAEKFLIYENYLYKETEESLGEKEQAKKVLFSDEKLINVTNDIGKLNIISNKIYVDNGTTEVLDGNQVSKTLNNESIEVHDSNQASKKEKSTAIERSSEEHPNNILNGSLNLNSETFYPEVIAPQSKIPKKKGEKKNWSSKKKDPQKELACIVKDDKKINIKKELTPETSNINKESNAFHKDTKKKAKHLDNTQCIKLTTENKLKDNQKDSQQDDKDLNIDAKAVNFHLDKNCIEKDANKELENLKETGINNLARENLLLKDELIRLREKYGEDVKDSNDIQDTISKDNRFDCYEVKIPSSSSEKGYPTYDENGTLEQYANPKYQTCYPHIPNYHNHENTNFQNTDCYYQHNEFSQNNNTQANFSDNTYYYPEMYYNQQTPQYYYNNNSMHYYHQREQTIPEYDPYNYYCSNNMSRVGDHTELFDTYGYPLHNDPSSVDMNTYYGYQNPLENLKRDDYLPPEINGQYEINNSDYKKNSDTLLDAHNNSPKEAEIQECKMIDNQNGCQKYNCNPQDKISIKSDLKKIDRQISNSQTRFSLF